MMKNIFVLSQEMSVAHTFLNQLRDKDIQKDRMRFKRNIERIGELLAYEISKTFNYTSRNIETPLANTTGHEIEDEIVLVTILRAGLPFLEGFQHIFDNADCAFIASYRANTPEENVTINMEYIASGDLNGKTIIIADPMLATGKSLLLGCQGLLKNGKPKHIHIAATIAAQDGIDYICKHFDEVPFSLWLGAIDAELNSKSYIVPGLGDAGDLCFGGKL